MKKYTLKFNKIGKVTKTITIVSLLFYLLGIFSLIVNTMIINSFSLDISEFSYSTIYEVFTYPFVHNYHPSHLLFNLALLIIFGDVIEKEIGKKSYLLLIFFGWVFNFLPMMFLGNDNRIMGLSGIVISIITFNLFVSKKTSNSVKFLGFVYFMDSFLKFDFLTNMSVFGHVMSILGGLLFVIIYKTKKVTF